MRDDYNSNVFFFGDNFLFTSLDNNIGDSGMAYIADVLLKNSNLLTLRLSSIILYSIICSFIHLFMKFSFIPRKSNYSEVSVLYFGPTGQEYCTSTLDSI